MVLLAWVPQPCGCRGGGSLEEVRSASSPNRVTALSNLISTPGKLGRGHLEAELPLA